MFLLLNLQPAPHETEQAAKLSHALTVQSTGHSPAPHVPDSVLAGQSTPPHTAGRVSLRKRCLVPAAPLVAQV